MHRTSDIFLSVVLCTNRLKPTQLVQSSSDTDITCSNLGAPKATLFGAAKSVIHSLKTYRKSEAMVIGIKDHEGPHSSWQFACASFIGSRLFLSYRRLRIRCCGLAQLLRSMSDKYSRDGGRMHPGAPNSRRGMHLLSNEFVRR